jgi:CheY-like chemotaxis protein
MTAFSILAVEDHPIEQRLLSMLGIELGLEMCVVKCGRDAIETFKGRKDFDLILMDVSMPGDSGEDMDGLECARKIRELEEGAQRVPIIAVTAHAMLGDQGKCMEAGMDDYLSKPFTYEQFSNKIFHWLEAKQPQTSTDASGS